MREKLRFSKKGWFLVIVCVLVLPLAGYYGVKAWRYYSTHVTTDNAYVDVTVAQITPRVSGAVAEVLVEDNWWVKPGQVLVRLDPQEYEVRVADAKAALQKARETVDQLFAAVAVAQERTKEANAQVAAAQAQLTAGQAEFHQADLDLQRAQELSAQEIIPVQQLDLAKTRYNVALSRLTTQQKQLEQSKQAEGTRAKELEQAKAVLGAATTTERAAHSLAKQAEAVVREAELNLSYCMLVAPIEGIVSKRSVEIGQRVQPGQPLMAVVPLHHVYIEANYKETQLTDVRVGQPAEIRADIYPGYVYRGKVDSLSAGTGAAFSLLPPENATGNWVKVVQRLPVKITLAEPPPADKPLRIGLSVEVTINTSDRQGPLLSSLLQDERQRRNSLPSTDGIKPASLDTLPRHF
ncbi:MAG TPA: HlyD family secretion protein [Candidatus Binatia bacterium]|nr:HlyD family secretion protein [Candidatus Binatia bacterium]